MKAVNWVWWFHWLQYNGLRLVPGDADAREMVVESESVQFPWAQTILFPGLNSYSQGFVTGNLYFSVSQNPSYPSRLTWKLPSFVTSLLTSWTHSDQFHLWLLTVLYHFFDNFFFSCVLCFSFSRSLVSLILDPWIGLLLSFLSSFFYLVFWTLFLGRHLSFIFQFLWWIFLFVVI